MRTLLPWPPNDLVPFSANPRQLNRLKKKIPAAFRLRGFLVACQAAGISDNASGDQQDFSGGVPSFQVTVGLMCITQRIGGADPNLEVSVGGSGEDFP